MNWGAAGIAFAACVGALVFVGAVVAAFSFLAPFGMPIQVIGGGLLMCIGAAIFVGLDS